MTKPVKHAAVTLVVIFVVAQFIRPDRTNPPIDATRTTAAHLGTTNAAVAILDRSCGDCHSNMTVWPWYTHVAPASWLMSYGVREGRKAVNFSEWAGYPADQQRILLALSCQDATEGKMPGPYALLRPETRLTPLDIDTLCKEAP